MFFSKAMTREVKASYATLTAPLVTWFFLVSMNGYMHLSEPMKRYATTLDSHGNNLKREHGAVRPSNTEQQLLCDPNAHVDRHVQKQIYLWTDSCWSCVVVLTLSTGRAGMWGGGCTLMAGLSGWRSWPAPRSTEAPEEVGAFPLPPWRGHHRHML